MLVGGCHLAGSLSRASLPLLLPPGQGSFAFSRLLGGEGGGEGLFWSVMEKKWLWLCFVFIGVSVATSRLRQECLSSRQTALTFLTG